jgi:hypothetical protein
MVGSCTFFCAKYCSSWLPIQNNLLQTIHLFAVASSQQACFLKTVHYKKCTILANRYQVKTLKQHFVERIRIAKGFSWDGSFYHQQWAVIIWVKQNWRWLIDISISTQISVLQKSEKNHSLFCTYSYVGCLGHWHGTVFGSLEVCSKIQIFSQYLLNISCTQYLFLRHIISENKKQKDFWCDKS